MYIMLMALKREKTRTKEGFIETLKEVIAPISLTSAVNASMFAIMNISDVPAVFLTARVALIAVCFLYVSIIFCFSAYCYLDMSRQKAGRHDVVFCLKTEAENEQANSDKKCVGTWLSSILYEKGFHPLLLKESSARPIFRGIIWIVAVALFGVAIYGITEREVGLGLEDFFPYDHQANKWATTRTEHLGSWSIGINWGALNYSNPDTQMKMIRQFEEVVAHPNIAEVDTKQLWMAAFQIWTTRHCAANVARSNPDVYRCGRDQIWAVDDSTCAGTWRENIYNLREKNFAAPGTCQAHEGGVCRPTREMHPSDLMELGIDPKNISDTEQEQVWCPVFDGWSNEKVAFCIQQWRFLAGGGGGFVLEDDVGSPTQCAGEYYNDERIDVSIPYSSGPTMFAFELTSHEITTAVIEETRAICDDSKELHCWMIGTYGSPTESLYLEFSKG